VVRVARTLVPGTTQVKGDVDVAGSLEVCSGFGDQGSKQFRNRGRQPRFYEAPDRTHRTRESSVADLFKEAEIERVFWVGSPVKSHECTSMSSAPTESRSSGWIPRSNWPETWTVANADVKGAVTIDKLSASLASKIAL